MYDIDSFEDYCAKPKYNVIYARVSTTKQKEDLNRQIEMVKGYVISN